MAKALSAFWESRGDTPIEIHLEGEMHVGKSTLIARTATLLWGTYIPAFSTPDQMGLDQAPNGSMRHNGLAITNIDEAQRRYGWDDYPPRCENLHEIPSGKAALFVEHPCETRRMRKDHSLVATHPDIIIKLEYPLLSISQALGTKIPALQEAIVKTWHTARAEAEAQGSSVPECIVRRMSQATYRSAGDDRSTHRIINQCFAPRRMEALFSQQTFAPDDPCIAAFKADVPDHEKAWYGFRRMRAGVYDDYPEDAAPTSPVFEAEIIPNGLIT